LTQSNLDKLRSVYARFWDEGDWDAGQSVFAPHIEWLGSEAIGLDGERVGPRGIGKFFADWLEAWEDYSNDVQIHELTPDVFVCESHFRGRGKGSGIEFEMELGQIWEFKDGLAVRQRMFRSYAEAREAAEQLVKADVG
jgi:ketosteroid isomerase-like protein